MLSDIVLSAPFPRHTTTSGGRSATQARTPQPDKVFTLPTRPAAPTAKGQTMATVALIGSICMSEVYGVAPHGAVPECTGIGHTHPCLGLLGRLCGSLHTRGRPRCCQERRLVLTTASDPGNAVPCGTDEHHRSCQAEGAVDRSPT
jgi:hypothetical protein